VCLSVFSLSSISFSSLPLPPPPLLLLLSSPPFPVLFSSLSLCVAFSQILFFPPLFSLSLFFRSDFPLCFLLLECVFPCLNLFFISLSASNRVPYASLGSCDCKCECMFTYLHGRSTCVHFRLCESHVCSCVFVWLCVCVHMCVSVFMFVCMC